MKEFKELPNWRFDMEEVSANVYTVIAKNSEGGSISKTGVDLDELIEECKKDALRLEALKEK
ncbi:hypothetical protein QSV34_10915 [Porticoccus sp. W117]|uniref:hypothetical protein n=1 Tax=Porticoccus sp. W117 TaxID=3054777 RepID=UPI0025990200|nr:hypothetical protein [Porticoccus sp. W117]MDM3871861.1 hypothetical protein [Porticoccus sp. W117]